MQDQSEHLPSGLPEAIEFGRCGGAENVRREPIPTDAAQFTNGSFVDLNWVP
ncbi:hypothetical protein KIN_38910 [Litoreibacter roseus]|uniref:Uncharacterized protein n=1 Tax=Litoreibacter roseus TaxID=2601869 RepID=A0A6N6JLH9_9RHOB|nr:hypothetical protein KIN_38910 [Litoreibacter roseus]